MDKKIFKASGWELQNLPDDSLKKDKEIVLIFKSIKYMASVSFEQYFISSFL